MKYGVSYVCGAAVARHYVSELVCCALRGLEKLKSSRAYNTGRTLSVMRKFAACQKELVGFSK